MTIPNKNWVDLGKLDGPQGREDKQYGWQNIFGSIIQNKTILDVGAGLGKSRERLAKNSNIVTLQDICQSLDVDITRDISEISSDSYDIVTAFDVIEHVENDKEFIYHISRIAKEAIVITTPNRKISKCTNIYHCREYNPEELVEWFDINKIKILMSGKNMVHTIHCIDEFVKHMDPSQAIMVSTK